MPLPFIAKCNQSPIHGRCVILFSLLFESYYSEF